MHQNQTAQMYSQLVAQRRSIRAFLPKAVPQQTLEQIFTDAAHTPSNCNSQPWHTVVVSGAARDSMSEALINSVGKGEFEMDFIYDPKQYQGVYRERQVEVGKMLYEALDIGRDDKEGRQASFINNLKFFGAPHAAFLFMPDWCGIREAADVGMYAQTLILSMQAHGLASCPQAILGYNAPVVREQLGVGEEMKLLFGISFGFEDKSKPENQICPSRADLLDTVTFLD